METFPQGWGRLLRTLSVNILIPLFLIGTVLSPSGCSHESAPYSAPQGTPKVRVLLLENQTRVTLAAVAPPIVHVGRQSPAQQLNFPPGISVPLELTPTGWQLGTAQLGPGELLMEPSQDGSVRVGSHAYHGRY